MPSHLVLRCVVKEEGIQAPNPNRHNGAKTLVDAVVQNIDEDLQVEDFVYNAQTGMYTR